MDDLAAMFIETPAKWTELSLSGFILMNFFISSLMIGTEPSSVQVSPKSPWK
jgi:hypothetical protein